MTDPRTDLAFNGPDAPDVIRLPVPSRAFVPFDDDVAAAQARRRRVPADQLPTVTVELIAQALEEVGRIHATCPGRGTYCDECWWLSRAIAAGRVGGWLA